jgi:hypothetical protein
VIGAPGLITVRMGGLVCRLVIPPLWMPTREEARAGELPIRRGSSRLAGNHEERGSQVGGMDLGERQGGVGDEREGDDGSDAVLPPGGRRRRGVQAHVGEGGRAVG